MRLIRFLGDDGRVHHGEAQPDGAAIRLVDPQGVLGPAAACDRRELFRGRHALVADDDEKMRELLTAVLTSAGCECEVCADGAEALRVIEQGHLDLIVSDIVMPGVDGYTIFSAARARDESLPVVLVTGFGYDPTHALVRASQDGLTSVLYKPFTPQQLLDEVDLAIRLCTSSPAAALRPTGERVGVSKILAPLLPTNVLCLGGNYVGGGGAASERDHPSDDELEVFMKPTTSVIGPGEAIRIPDFGGTDPLVDVEGELAVIIGREARNIPEEQALDYVLGFAAANDVTARHWQGSGGGPRWMRGKGFDTFCPLGPALVTPDEVDADDLTVRTTVNGATVRHGSTHHMLRSVAGTVSALSRHLTLLPGTAILTGAPPPDHPDVPMRLGSGDEVAVEIDGIGRLANHVEVAVGERPPAGAAT